ncbi:hypothetical protein GCM10009745_59580 [Kribbella yunnanensis]|uniref:DUF2236 domain-containing protein n=1 Tax=Kribbella yunnanensis TaxID=190194 RepID=A0ABN2IG18_9ACTN
MHQIALYHPNIQFPSDAWIKTAALYWTKVGRIVPEEYPLRDSDVVCALRDGLDFVLDVDPYWVGVRSRAACDVFQHFVQRYFRVLDCYRVEMAPNHLARSFRAVAGPPYLTVASSGDVSSSDYSSGDFVRTSKVSPKLVNVLTRHGLARMDGHGLWMHQSLARVYMSALAEDVAAANQLQPVTDDAEAFAVAAGWTHQRMMNLLLPEAARKLMGNVETFEQRSLRLPVPVGLVAVRAVVPRDLERIPASRIIEIRKEFGPQFLAFRRLADSVAADLEEMLASVQDPKVFRAYVEQEANDRLVGPAKVLRADLRRMHVKTAMATMTFKYELPTLAGVVAGGLLAKEPLLAGGAAVAAGLVGIAQGARQASSERRSDSPVGYLTLLGDKLKPQPAVHRLMHNLRRLNRPL